VDSGAFIRRASLTAEQFGDLFIWATLGVILGGRIGLRAVLTAWSIKRNDFLDNPLALCSRLGRRMSFHGGMIVFVLAIALCANARIDMVAAGSSAILRRR